MRAILIYQGIENRPELEVAKEEMPAKGLLFLHEMDVKRIFGEDYQGQVIRNWRTPLQHVVGTSKRYKDFYSFGLDHWGQQPLVRLMHL